MPANNIEDTRAVIGDTLCVSNQWLDYTQYPSSTADTVITTTGGTGWVDVYSNHSTYWPGYWYSGSSPRITLKLSEVMYLRELAAEDKKLHKVLKKFAPYIEITVEFPGAK